MTTTNGGRIVDHAEGIVQSSNDRGVKLVGEDGYRNFSKYAEPPITCRRAVPMFASAWMPPVSSARSRS
jgi:hypothetical protein